MKTKKSNQKIFKLSSSKMNKRGSIPEYLPPILIAVLILVVVFGFMFFLKRDVFSSVIDKVLGLVKGR